MKKLIILFSLALICGCTVIKIYTGTPPYYSTSTEILTNHKDTDSIDAVSVILENSGLRVILQDGNTLYDITGRKIK